MSDCRPWERDMMGGIQKPDLRCEEHSEVYKMVREMLLWLQELDERLKVLESSRRDTDLYEGE